jgi:hypothetical protein
VFLLRGELGGLGCGHDRTSAGRLGVVGRRGYQLDTFVRY